ncbi:hypothetical protein KO494_11870 [Lacinutrix sp. C3R15]|uniref:hypothetical protein n=1 Tax=Flavobacteriaceae TaxID=49546 RepID=UPI001C095CC4|nr:MULTISPECIES: hypothetical protein [Flavobacteriaceae]MBU2940235.1 hypothetical protein [Lacinutrix sp. C3R15]MDO6623553.1 hypothetical protein [Oceanihabitans sp. 1_MG-2023]
MKTFYLSLSLVAMVPFITFSQQADTISTTIKNGITKPSILSSHPFGMFFSRLQGNFKTHATKNKIVTISLESANVWGPPVTTYIPNDKATRNEARKYNWDLAQYHFDVEDLDAETFQLQIDGVIKSIKANIAFNLRHNKELVVALRLAMLTNGEYPFSFFTSDTFIEDFHSKIAGGKDPFDRKVFELNKAGIKYTDRNGNTAELEKNDAFISGIETAYYYYPEWLTNKKIFINIGAHLGTNLSKYNSSIDLGVSVNAIKKIVIKNKNYTQIGAGIGTLRKNAIDYNKNNVAFGTNKYLAFLESILEYNFISKKGTTHSIGLDFYIQTSLNKKEELNYIIPIRYPDAHDAWGVGTTNLYKNNNYWTLLYSFTKKITTTIYIQQDLTVNNNPDIQTGVSVSFKI